MVREPGPARSGGRRLPLALAVTAGCAVLIAACGSGSSSRPPTGTPSARTVTLPGTGKPAVTVGDKNFTEQFVLGELYRLALQADGYTVYLNQNIGSTEVTVGALTTGRLDIYPEYLEVWNQSVAGYQQQFPSLQAAYAAAQRYAAGQGLRLLSPTPFSDTSALVVSSNYAAENELNSIADLTKVAGTLTIGGPLQFQQDPNGLPAVQQAYGFQPAAFTPLDIGAQYQAIDQGTVQAVDANTTDGELVSGNYSVLKDPKHVFGVGNVVPVVSAKTLAAEGPAFARTINRVSALLTTEVIRQLNAAVDLSHETPVAVATQFLTSHDLIPAGQ